MSVVDDIKARLDIVDVVSGYVALQKSGRYFKALCPFHTEKTPSFIVNPERESWRCFGACATGGDVLSFVMRIENLDFGGVLRSLAQKTGVELSRTGAPDRSGDLYRINQVAARYYRDVLNSSRDKRGAKYLEKRGVDATAMSTFELGLSPDGWDGLKSHLLALGIEEGRAVEAGLLVKADNGNTRDFFRGRLMFPINDAQGRIAGFGARALDGSMPKYLNTQRTGVFDKQGILYGLHLASDSIRAEKTAVVVEGYMDVIAAHQHGYTNVVASMGTALTTPQVSLLKTKATDFVLALDPDAAGEEATIRSLESSWRIFEGQRVDSGRRSVGVLYRRDPLTLKIAALPPGKDPDDVIRDDPTEWERLTREAPPLLDYLIPAVAARFDLGTGQGKAQAAEVLFPLIESTEFFDQERYLRKLADVLDVTEETLKASIGTIRADVSRRRRRGRETEHSRTSPPSLLENREDSLEEYTLALLLSRPELKDGVRHVAPEHFRKSEGREIFSRWLACSTIDSLREALDPSLHDHLYRLVEKDLAPADQQQSEVALEQCIKRLERRYLKELQEGMLASDDAGVAPPREMEPQISNVNARLRELFAPRVR